MKAGIIGLGHGSRVLINSFKLSKISIRGIACRNLIKARKIAKENKIKITYRSWKDLVNDKNIHIVAIAIPAKDQIDIIESCIRENKIILCEKPIGINILKIKNIFLLLSKYKKIFLVDYIFPEHKIFKKFKNSINAQKIDKEAVVKVNFQTQTYANKYRIINWKSNPKKGGGIINLFLSHITDYLIFFFGKVRNVECNINKVKNFEINANCNIEFISGLKVSIFIDCDSLKKNHTIQYISKNFKFILENKGVDYCKKFKFFIIKLNSKNKKEKKEIISKDPIIKFEKDSRILLSSRIINKTKANFNDKNLKNNIERYRYNEYVLDKIRISEKRKIIIKIND